MTSVRFEGLERPHRQRLAEILVATGAFSAAEVGVALELFDETHDQTGWATGAGRGSSRPGAERLTDARAPSTYEFLGAFDGDALVAYACYGPTPGTDGTFDLYWIAVHPEAQGAGVGAQLLAEVEDRLRDRGARLLVAETSSRANYSPTRRFYDRRGYREAARVAGFYAPADDRVIYAKRLSAKATSADRQPPPTHLSSARSASP